MSDGFADRSEDFLFSCSRSVIVIGEMIKLKVLISELESR